MASGARPDATVELTASAAPGVGADASDTAESLAEQTAWDRPLVVARSRTEPALDEVAPEPVLEPQFEPDEPYAATHPGTGATALLALAAVVGSLVAGLRIADSEGWLSSPDVLARIGGLVAGWAAVTVLSRRCGGRAMVIGGFAAVAFGLAGAFPESWALAGAAATSAIAFGLLGMVLTRPAAGIAVARELVVSASIGLLGALTVRGFDVSIRPYRFRVLVLAAVLIGALLLAWRLGHGSRSIGRRGAAIIVVAVVVLIGAVAYAQAIRSWGSPGLLHNLTDVKHWLQDTVGAAPRPIEALVGFPAIVWGVAVRRRRRQGWWICAFGALGAASVTSSLIQPGTPLHEAMLSTGYDVLIGLAIGSILVLVDRLLTQPGGRRADALTDVDPERPEPPRFAALM